MMMSRPRFGVEIEYQSADIDAYTMAQKLSEAGLACESESYNHRVRDYWKLTTDSSCGLELVSPPLRYEDRFAVVEALRVLNRHGARITNDCGLHVHHEYMWEKAIQQEADYTKQQSRVRGRDRKEKKIVALYERCRPLLELVLNEDRFSESSGPGAARTGEAGGFCTWNGGSTSRDSRYMAINFTPLQDRTTIEFRQHQGTLDADEVLAWIEFTRQVVYVASIDPNKNFADMVNLMFEKISQSTYHNFEARAGGDLSTVINTIINPNAETE